MTSTFTLQMLTTLIGPPIGAMLAVVVMSFRAGGRRDRDRAGG